MKFTKKQEEAMIAIASELYIFILYGGAMGGGKTILGLSALLIMCQIFPKSRWCVIRENLEKIRTTTIPSFKKLNPSGKLRENPYEYEHPNGSVILFKGENYDNDKELDWLKGLEVCGFLFEEINECQEDTLDIAFGRIGRWECEPRPKPIILATCNPNFGWVKKRIYDKYSDDTLPENWLYIPAKVTDNEYLTADYLESLKNMPRYKYEVLVNGNWNIQLKVGGEFYKCFEIDKHIDKTKYNPDLVLHISWDENSVPYLPCGIFQIHKVVDIKGEIVSWEVHMIDEIAGEDPNNTVRAVCDEIKRKFPAHEAGMAVYGDATASKQDTKLEKGFNFYRLILDHLAQYKPSSRVLNSNPSVAMRGDWINTVLEKEIGKIKITIGENCEKTINDFILLKEAADRTKLKEMATNPKTKARYQKVGHFTDLFDYLMCSAFSSEYLSYQKGSTSVLITVGKNTRSKNSY